VLGWAKEGGSWRVAGEQESADGAQTDEALAMSSLNRMTYIEGT
jgi:hypothetical protein